MSSVILWFRRDFRVNNNPALDYALSLDLPVIPVYVYDPDDEHEWSPGAASRWWCYQSLKQLDKSLDKLGLGLHYFRGKPQKIIPRLVNETGARAVCFNRLYEPHETELEKSLLNLVSGSEMRGFDSQLLFTPGSILNNQDKPYRVFTPFWKKARVELELNQPAIVPGRKPQVRQVWKMPLNQECDLDKLGILDENPWHEKLHQYWSPGESSAQKRVSVFFDTCLESYELSRDYPGIEGTSRLSAHLHFGELTPAQIYSRLQQVQLSRNSAKDIERFVTELGWREFAHHVMWHFPGTVNKPMNKKFADFWPKKANQKYLRAWRKGKTGIPIIDAGMRELYETGWMHNRVRMIVASFLTKNLDIHWMHGARWFWDTLVDADLANNSLGWQWVAGCGVDAAPFYRIFNPSAQTMKFDKELDYISRWVPEMDKIRLPEIVDLKISREMALDRYRKLPG